MNKSLSVAVYAGVWLVLVLLQSFIISSSGLPEHSLWEDPRLYYSTWAVDFYLIILFYANYYAFAPKMIHRRLFRPYIWLVVLVALIGLALPIVLFGLLDWTMPGVPQGEMPISSLGVVGAVAVMAIGLSIRSLLEWVKLDGERTTVLVELTEAKERITKLETEMKLLGSAPTEVAKQPHSESLQEYKTDEQATL